MTPYCCHHVCLSNVSLASEVSQHQLCAYQLCACHYCDDLIVPEVYAAAIVPVTSRSVNEITHPLYLCTQPFSNSLTVKFLLYAVVNPMRAAAKGSGSAV